MSKVAFGAFIILLLAASAPAQTKRLQGEGEMCGGIAGFACSEGLWCDPEPGSCERSDRAGRCVSIPMLCTSDYHPVCGCDGKTYGNDCERRTMKASKRHDGACS